MGKNSGKGRWFTLKKTGGKAQGRAGSRAVDIASPPLRPSAEENHVKDDSSMTENPPAAEEREIARFGAWKPVTGFRSSLSRENKRTTWHDTGFPPFPPCLLLLLLLYISYERAGKNTGGQRRDRHAFDARTPSSSQLVISLRFEAVHHVARPFWQHHGLLVQANADGISCLIEKQAQPHDHIEHGMRTA